MKLFANRRTQCAGERPALAKTPMDERNLYACDLSPLYQRHTLPAPCQNPVGSSISLLLFFTRPAAVFGRVTFLVVYSIQRVLRGRTPAHVFEERFKRIFPAGADKNITITITVVIMILRIVAALDHMRPSVIFRTFAHIVRDKPKSSQFFPKAAAASYDSIAQMTASNDRGFPTDTATQPSKVSGFPSYRFQRCQPPEFLIGEISKLHAGIIS